MAFHISWSLVLLAAFSCTARASEKFLLISAAETNRISYLKLPDDDEEIESPRFLIVDGLIYPQGLAVDLVKDRQWLYVADPMLQKLVRYPLTYWRGGLEVGAMETFVDHVEVRAVAVDTHGNVFFTDEPNQRVMKVRAGSTEPEVVASAEDSSGIVSAPGGVATDNFFVYWTNKLFGTDMGTLIRAPASDSSMSPSVVSNNSQKCYGVAVGNTNFYYTDDTRHLYSIHRSDTEVVTVSSEFKAPRGLAFDGVNLMYVADKQLHGVYRFTVPNGKPESDTSMTKVADMQGAYALAFVEIYDRDIN